MSRGSARIAWNAPGPTSPRARATGRPRRRDAAYRDWLEEIEATEAAELDRLVGQDAQASDDERRKEVTRDLVEQKYDAARSHERPTRRAARRVISNYEFVSSEAREQFEQLMQRTPSSDVLNTYFQQSKEMMRRSRLRRAGPHARHDGRPFDHDRTGPPRRGPGSQLR